MSMDGRQMWMIYVPTAVQISRVVIWSDTENLSCDWTDYLSGIILVLVQKENCRNMASL